MPTCPDCGREINALGRDAGGGFHPSRGCRDYAAVAAGCTTEAEVLEHMTLAEALAATSRGERLPASILAKYRITPLPEK